MNDKMQQISDRIKELREILELSAETVASLSGLDLSDYIAYESAEADMPISALYAVANVLNVDPTVLLTGDSPRMNAYTIIRQGKGVSIERYKGYSFTSLAANYIGRDMEPMIVDIGKKDRKPHLVTHSGQEFNYVLQGQIGVTIGSQTFELATGDSIYFNPAIPHGQFSISNTAKFLTVINENAKKK